MQRGLPGCVWPQGQKISSASVSEIGTDFIAFGNDNQLIFVNVSLIFSGLPCTNI